MLLDPTDAIVTSIQEMKEKLNKCERVKYLCYSMDIIKRFDQECNKLGWITMTYKADKYNGNTTGVYRMTFKLSDKDKTPVAALKSSNTTDTSTKIRITPEEFHKKMQEMQLNALMQETVDVGKSYNASASWAYGTITKENKEIMEKYGFVITQENKNSIAMEYQWK